MGDGGEHPGHGTLCLMVGGDGIRHINESDVDAGAWRREEMPVEPICLAAASSHLHTVHGVAQPFLGHGDEKLCHRCAMGVYSPDHTPGVCHNGNHRRVGGDAPGAE